MSAGIDTNEVIKNAIDTIGVNATFVMVIAPLSIALFIVLFWAKFIQGQSLTSLTTSRQKIDWKRVLFSFSIWAGITIVMILVPIGLHQKILFGTLIRRSFLFFSFGFAFNSITNEF
jgi:uncharacterized protein